MLSASGGCGASTLAVNVAAVLARDHGRCNLIDLHPGMGDLPALLNLKPQFNLADVCRNEARLDRAMFEMMLFPGPAGISLLAAPPNFADARCLTSSGVGLAVSFARKLFPSVVVDMEDCFHLDWILKNEQALRAYCPEFASHCRLDPKGTRPVSPSDVCTSISAWTSHVCCFSTQ